jgi:excisionase family DNA binding protein
LEHHRQAFDFSTVGKLAFTVAEVRRFTGLSKSSIYRLFSSGRLRSVKVAGRRLIMRYDLEVLFAQGVSAPHDRERVPTASRKMIRSMGGSHER